MIQDKLQFIIPHFKQTQRYKYNVAWLTMSLLTFLQTPYSLLYLGLMRKAWSGISQEHNDIKMHQLPCSAVFRIIVLGHYYDLMIYPHNIRLRKKILFEGCLLHFGAFPDRKREEYYRFQARWAVANSPSLKHW